MDSQLKVFDTPYAMSLAESKRRFLNTFLPELIQAEGLQTALDVGCGFGYFSAYLRDLGLQVAAFDARPENVLEARGRHPDIAFDVVNIEDPSVVNLGQFDVVLCLGLLYHLENPFCAVRHLFALTRKVCLIESIVSPSPSLLTALVQEPEGQDQGLNYIAQVPSQSWLLKVLYKWGFPFVYKTTALPAHSDFRWSLLRRPMRTFLVAAKGSLEHKMLKLAPEPKTTNQYMWYPPGIRHVLDNEGIRKALRAGLTVFKRG